MQLHKPVVYVHSFALLKYNSHCQYKIFCIWIDLFLEVVFRPLLKLQQLKVQMAEIYKTMTDVTQRKK